MKFQLTSTALLFLLSSVSQALPSPVANDAILARDIDIDDEPDKDWECPAKNNNIKFSKDYIIKSIEKGAQMYKDGDSYNDYPKPINEPSSIGIDEDGDVQHYPLVYRGSNEPPVYGAGTGISDARVMWKQEKGSDDAKFLGLWTHYGAPTGKYQKCKEA